MIFPGLAALLQAFETANPLASCAYRGAIYIARWDGEGIYVQRRGKGGEYSLKKVRELDDKPWIYTQGD